MRLMLMFILSIVSSTTFAAVACPNYAMFAAAEKNDYNKYVQSIQCRVMNAVGRNYDFNRYTVDNICIQQCHDEKPERAKISPFDYSTYNVNWEKFETCVITKCKAAVAAANAAARTGVASTGTSAAGGTTSGTVLNLNGTTSVAGSQGGSSTSAGSTSAASTTVSNNSGNGNVTTSGSTTDNTAAMMQMMQITSQMGANANKGPSTFTKEQQAQIDNYEKNGVGNVTADAKVDTVEMTTTTEPSSWSEPVEIKFGPDGTQTAKFDPVTREFQGPDGTHYSPEQISDPDLCGDACLSAASDVPPAAATQAKQIVSNDVSPDAASAEAIAAAKANNTQFQAQMKQITTSGITFLDARIAACSGTLVSCVPGPQALIAAKAALATIQTKSAAYQGPQTSCSSSAGNAQSLCSIIRNPKILMIQQLMTLGSTLLTSTSSAAKTCKMTGNLSKISQIGMLAANVACTGMKVMCDRSCESGQKLLQAMESENKAVVAGAPNIAAQITKLVGVELSQSNAPRIAQCRAHAADIAMIATQALGLALAANQAKSCEKALCSGSGCNSDGKKAGIDSLTKPEITTAEYCSVAKNANEFLCVCMKSPDNPGCPGAIVKNDQSDADKLKNDLVTTKTGNPNSLVKTTGNQNNMGNGLTTGKQPSNLSKAARAALGLDGSKNSGSGLDSAAANAAADALAADAAGGAAAGAGGGGRGSGGFLGALSGNDSSRSGSGSDKKGAGNGDFGVAGGGYGGGGYGDGSSGKNGANNKDYSEKQKDDIKRKIASDQFRAEVTTSTGRSNWDKVRTRYTENRSTLLGQ